MKIIDVGEYMENEWMNIMDGDEWMNIIICIDVNKSWTVGTVPQSSDPTPIKHT